MERDGTERVHSHSYGAPGTHRRDHSDTRREVSEDIA
ncbi:hypothetical protein SFR_1818 [Streptomyces sp. FR-008]|nr:hypothetical protein SFR_1818 [Streptomyces sp. FR-008]